MKKIEAIIRPSKLEVVKRALASLGVRGMTVSNVRGYGDQNLDTAVYRGVSRRVEFAPKIKLEIVVVESIAEQVVEAIVEGARTGHAGDGKIFVKDIESVTRIRTGATNRWERRTADEHPALAHEQPVERGLLPSAAGQSFTVCDGSGLPLMRA